jgi:hypothetical protein
MTLIVISHQKAGEQKDRRVDEKNELSWIVKSKTIEKAGRYKMTLYACPLPIPILRISSDFSCA